MYRYVTIGALLIFATAVRSEEKYKVDKDITYRKVDNKELKLDIAYPEGKGPYPAILCVHGGAWRFGKRTDIDWMPEWFAREGYVAATISYRLLPDGKFPGPVEDCKTAVRWLRANADKYHINKDRIGAVGLSAGGHLVCMLGLTETKDGFDGKDCAECSSKVQAVVDYFGPTDLCLYGGDYSAENTTFVPMLGAAFKEKPEVYRKASPINYVTKNAPPFLIVHGTKDWLVPIEHSRKLLNKLKETGGKPEIFEVKDEGHGDWDGQMWRKTMTATSKFFAEHLKK
jgi:acetyl esterase/lipase